MVHCCATLTVIERIAGNQSLQLLSELSGEAKQLIAALHNVNSGHC